MMMEPQINPVVNGMRFHSLMFLFLGISFVCVQFPQTQGIVVNMKKWLVPLSITGKAAETQNSP